MEHITRCILHVALSTTHIAPGSVQAKDLQRTLRAIEKNLQYRQTFSIIQCQERDWCSFSTLRCGREPFFWFLVD
jgi:hypothetical protein